MKVKVTDEHIKCGVCGAPRSCPIALAIKEQRPHVRDDELWVGAEYVDIKEYAYELPDIARQFVGDFDNKRPVAPFEFELELRDA